MHASRYRYAISIDTIFRDSDKYATAKSPIMRNQEIVEYRPWALMSLGHEPAPDGQISHQSKLEARVIALETKLRHSKPDHPCDCKYELSILEEKLGTLRQHPWERRLSELEAKQKRDTLDLSKVYDEFQEQQAKIEQLVSDYHWDYDSEERINNVVKPTNIIYVVERMLSKMKRFDKYRAESEDCIRVLKSCYERMTVDSQHQNRDLNHAQTSVQDELRGLKNEAKQLKDDIADLRDLKEKLTDDLLRITKRVDHKVEELENTVTSITRACRSSSPEIEGSQVSVSQSSPKRTIWVPPSSVKPIETPYPYNIPMFMEQPKGWGEIRAGIYKVLEESQRVYYSPNEQMKEEDDAGVSHEAGDIANTTHVLAGSDLSELDDDIPKRRKRKKRTKARPLLVLPALSNVPEDSREEDEPDRWDTAMDNTLFSEDLQLTDGHGEAARADDPVSLPETLSKVLSDIGEVAVSVEDHVPEAPVPQTIFKKYSRELATKKSKSSLGKSKSAKILKTKDKSRYARIDGIFKQGKECSAQNVSASTKGTNKDLF